MEERLTTDTDVDSRARRRAHRVVPTETLSPLVASADYVDAFEVARNPTDRRSAEQWARDGFGSLPEATRRPLLLTHRWILGFRLGPWSSSDHILGWRIMTSEPELLHLEARSYLFRGHMLWRLHPDRLTMTTLLDYEVPGVAPAIWGVVGNVHRNGSPYLLSLAAKAERDDEQATP
jgi:hypothetical protein